MCDTKRRSFLKSSAGLFGGTLLASGAPMHSHSVAVHAPDVMADTANRLLAALDADQLAKARIEFSEDERRNWHYVPLERKGLQLRHMTPISATSPPRFSLPASVKPALSKPSPS